LLKNNIVVQYRRTHPLFSPTTWNVNFTTLSEGYRSNNACESWNSRFSLMVGQNHPTIWKLITKIRYEISADRATLALDELGEQSIKRKKENGYKNTRLNMYSFLGK